MERLFEPSLAFEWTCHADDGRSKRIALVLPSTRAVVRHASALGPSWLTVGCQAGMSNAASTLRRIASGAETPSVLILTDQLYHPADTNILAVLEGRAIFLSPLEFILADKYGYALGVWTSPGMVWSPPGASVGDVCELIATHLRDCSQLGQDWLERERQAIRTIGHRFLSAKRQLRLLRSSTANAYMDDPSNPVAQALVDRIATLEVALQRQVSV